MQNFTEIHHINVSEIGKSDIWPIADKKPFVHRECLQLNSQHIRLQHVLYIPNTDVQHVSQIHDGAFDLPL